MCLADDWQHACVHRWRQALFGVHRWRQALFDVHRWRLAASGSNRQRWMRNLQLSPAIALARAHSSREHCPTLGEWTTFKFDQEQAWPPDPPHSGDFRGTREKNVSYGIPVCSGVRG